MNTKKDVTQIYYRTAKNETTIKVIDMTREEAIAVYELIAQNPTITFACAFVVGGGRI